MKTGLLEDKIKLLKTARDTEAKSYSQLKGLVKDVCINYDPKDEEVRELYSTLQNKIHFDITGKTAGEIIVERVGHYKENMGLYTWANIDNESGSKNITKNDVSNAKNYLNGEELIDYNEYVTGSFFTIKKIIGKEIKFTKYEDFTLWFDEYLKITHSNVLEGKGRISTERAKQIAEYHYGKYKERLAIEKQQVKEIQNNTEDTEEKIVEIENRDTEQLENEKDNTTE